jgi:transposase
MCDLRLQPLVDALKAHVLQCAVGRADETPMAMLTPGKGKTHRTYLWLTIAADVESIMYRSRFDHSVAGKNSL